MTFQLYFGNLRASIVFIFEVINFKVCFLSKVAALLRVLNYHSSITLCQKELPTKSPSELSTLLLIAQLLEKKIHKYEKYIFFQIHHFFQKSHF